MSVAVDRGKRALDIALSGLGLLVSWPVWGIVALAIWIDDGRPIFYFQDRVGPWRARVPRLEVPINDYRRRARWREAGASGGRPDHERGQVAARHGARRVAPVVEHLPRRHELRRAAGASSGRDRGARRRAPRAARGRARLRSAVRGPAGTDRRRADLRVARYAAAAEVPVRPGVHYPAIAWRWTFG